MWRVVSKLGKTNRKNQVSADVGTALRLGAFASEVIAGVALAVAGDKLTRRVPEHQHAPLNHASDAK